MGYYLNGGGFTVDDVEFRMYVPGEPKEELGKCASCKSWYSRVKELALWVDYDQIKVEVCPNCAEDYHPEAVTI